MTTLPTVIVIHYDSRRFIGRFELTSVPETSIWERLQQAVLNLGLEYEFRPNQIELPWIGVLAIVRELGNQGSYRLLNFRFRSGDDQAREKLSIFAAQYKRAQSSKGQLLLSLDIPEIESRLIAAGFSRELKSFQLRDLQRLLSLENGANFSVPGAGKTTVTFALHMLTRKAGQHVLVIGPKAAFPAWREVVDECMRPDAPGGQGPGGNAEPFTVLSGSAESIAATLSCGRTRFVINYDLMIQIPEVILSYLAQQPIHLILDESHRMKAGFGSQRGALLLNLADLPLRRDILSGTPMPQHPSDIQSQLDFLWPGMGLGQQISRGVPPRDVLGELYVRTTKEDLGLPKPHRQFVHVPMAKGQTALYGIVKADFLRQASNLRFDNRLDTAAARKSVMRLLQLSANPTLALRSMVDDAMSLNSGIIDKVISEGPSNKMRAVANFARSLAKEGRKSVIWTIFTDTIVQLEAMLADLNPVSLYGAVPSGEATDPTTREGKLRRFHEDPSCQLMIANPAAAGEGISLHKVCHDAIYLDRSYVTTHFLQSIDRIHRLGLPEGVETNIYIYQTLTPQGLGSIDHSVSRRLAQKLRALQILLDDVDLHQIALDEENADEPIAWDIAPDDVKDLIEELEGRVPYEEEQGE